MLFKADLHERIRTGEVTVAFRRWKRPTVRPNGTLQSPAGVLAIDEVTRITEQEITLDDARRAGEHSVQQIRADLREGSDRALYRIRFHRVGDDPRVELRHDAELSKDDRQLISDQLRRWDAASRTGPWTGQALDAIATHPEQPSRVLAEDLGIDQPRLKRRIRQLKRLGLTESLGTGYRISPRGHAYRGRSDAD